MANLSSIARPYAVAAFEWARDKQQLPAWKSFLETAAEITHDPDVAQLLTHPDTVTHILFDLFHDILANQLDGERESFLRLLVQKKRLIVLPEIVELFNAYYAQYEKISTVRVVTAVSTKEDFRRKLKDILARRTQREVELECQVDPSIIGGAIIHIGDSMVIDASIREQLSRLLKFSLR